MFATFLDKVRLKNSINKRNFTVFFRFLVCSYAGCSYPVTGQIFQNKTSFFIGCHNFSRKGANEKRSFVLKNLASNKIRASRIATYKKSEKYCKISFIYEVFKPYFDKKSCKQVSKIMLEYLAFLSCLEFAILNSFYLDKILKPKQVICLANIFLRKDVLCVLPTGYGKSLIFHLVPMMLFAKGKLTEGDF